MHYITITSPHVITQYYFLLIVEYVKKTKLYSIVMITRRKEKRWM